MALISKTTTWNAGDALTATALNAEFDTLFNALTGAASGNLKVTYNNTDLPTVDIITTIAAGTALRLITTQTGAKALVVNDGSSDVASIDDSGKGVFDTLETTQTTVATNLNADQVDGIEGANIATLDGNPIFSQASSQCSITVSGEQGAFITVEDSNSLGKLRLYVPNASQSGNLEAWNGSSYDTALQFVGPSNEVESDFIWYQNNTMQINQSLVWKKGFLVDQATIYWDINLTGPFGQITLTANRTLGNLVNSEVGAKYILVVKQSGGPHTLSWGSNYKFPAGGTGIPDIAASNSTNLIEIFVDETNSFLVTQLGKNYQ